MDILTLLVKATSSLKSCVPNPLMPLIMKSISSQSFSTFEDGPKAVANKHDKKR